MNFTVCDGVHECTVESRDVIEKHFEELESRFFDYYVVPLDDGEGPFRIVGVENGPKYMPIPKNHAYKKKYRHVIYVLANSDETFRKATEFYKDAPWARVIFIPTTYYLESVMYISILPRRKEEWEHADFVGCIAWSAHTKQPNVINAHRICDTAEQNGDTVVVFMYRGDPLVDTAEKWHPGFKELWIKCLKTFGWLDEIILNPRIPSFYCNYWACTPELMEKYCGFALKMVHRIESNDDVSQLIWKDSSYLQRGTDIAKLNESQCMHIWGVPYYPFHPFLFERLPCIWLALFSKGISGIR